MSFIRNTRVEKQIPQKEKLVLYIKAVNYKHDFDSVIIKLGNLSEILITSGKVEGAVCFITSWAEFYIPVGDLHNYVEERTRLEKELEYAQGFLTFVMQKLNNDKFINSAPAKVIELENRKKTDTETKIRAIEERIKSMIKK